jgi:hypothetical protein
MNKREKTNIDQCCKRIDDLLSGAAGVAMIDIEGDIEFEREKIHRNINYMSHSRAWVLVILFSIFYFMITNLFFADSYLVLQMGRGASVDFSWVISLLGWGFWIGGALLLDKVYREHVVQQLEKRYAKWLIDCDKM